MFSIIVEEVFDLGDRKGVILIGKTSGVIKIGDFLIEISNSTKQHKVIGLEMVHYTNSEKNLTHNPAIMIEPNNYDSKEFKGKTYKSQ